MLSLLRENVTSLRVTKGFSRESDCGNHVAEAK